MKQITKSYLEYLGITEVTPDGKIFTKNGERKPSLRSRPGKYSNNNGYLELMFFDSEKYQEIPKLERASMRNSVRPRVLVHQAVYAWFNNEVPYGKEIHHRDGNCLNNHRDNLIALTPEEHRKEHKKMRELERQEALVEEKCRLDIPREHYVKKIKEYSDKGDYANANQYKRRLKYYDNHITEANQKIKDAKDLELLKYLKDTYRKANDKARWHMFNAIIKEWKTYPPKIKEEIMQCALGKIGRFGTDSEGPCI